MRSRALLVGLALAVPIALGVAWWTTLPEREHTTLPRSEEALQRGKGPADPIEPGDAPAPDDELPPDEEAQTTRGGTRESKLDSKTRKALSGAGWCGTDVVDEPRAPELEPLPDAPLPDDFVRLLRPDDVPWHALLDELVRTYRDVDRLARMRTFLLERSKTATRGDVADLIEVLVGNESSLRVARRLQLAADALRRSAHATWAAFLDRLPPPPAPPKWY